jgi:hypothetical protein
MRASMSRVAKRLARAGLIASGVLTALALVACGDDDADEETPTPTLIAIPTAINVLEASFTPVSSSTGTYSLLIPEGFVASGLNPVSNEEVWQVKDGERLITEIAVTCETIPTDPITGQPWDVRRFIERDRGFRDTIGALGAEEGGEFGVTVADVPAVGTYYTVRVQDVAIRQQAVYLIKDDCLWIIRLRVFGDGDAEGYAQLFGRVLGSFQTVEG